MTATTPALIGAASVLLAALISGLGGVALGAWLTSRTQRQQAEALRAQQLEDQVIADLRAARDESAEAYVMAREGVSWLHSVRVEDCVSEPWKSAWAGDLRDSLQQITTARLTLDRTSTVIGDVPLGRVARDTAHQLLLLRNAWQDALHHAEGMIGAHSRDWHTQRWGKAIDEIDSTRLLLTGGELTGLHNELRAGFRTEDGLLNQLRSEIGNAARSTP